MKNSQDEAEFDRIKARVHAVKKDFIKAVLNIPVLRKYNSRSPMDSSQGRLRDKRWEP